jgi:hypothetical protein
LKLKRDELLSNVAFNFNVRRYTPASCWAPRPPSPSSPWWGGAGCQYQNPC